MKKSIALLFIIIALAWVNPVDAQEPDKSGFIRTYAKPGGLLSFEWMTKAVLLEPMLSQAAFYRSNGLSLCLLAT